MLIAVVFLVVAVFAVWRSWCDRERPLDGAELQFIRRFDDQTRREQIHPFE
jgi:hypothetical protein